MALEGPAAAEGVGGMVLGAVLAGVRIGSESVDEAGEAVGRDIFPKYRVNIYYWDIEDGEIVDDVRVSSGLAPGKMRSGRAGPEVSGVRQSISRA